MPLLSRTCRLRDDRVNVVVTVGGNGDPFQFGPLPPQMRIIRGAPSEGV